MNAKTNEEREALRLIAEAIAEDLLEAPLDEALKEIDQAASHSSREGDALRRDALALITRMKKERLIAAKQAYEQQRSRSASLRSSATFARDVLIEKVKEVLARHPEFEGKIGFAFRDREKVTDRELASILEDLEELEVHAASEASKT